MNIGNFFDTGTMVAKVGLGVRSWQSSFFYKGNGPRFWYAVVEITPIQFVE